MRLLSTRSNRPFRGCNPCSSTTSVEERHDDGHLSKLRVFAVIGRRSLPSLIEATLSPALLFYVCLVHIGPGVAMIAALSWSYGAVVRRMVFDGRVPAILGSRCSVSSRCERCSV